MTQSDQRFLNPYNFVRYLPEPKVASPETALLGRCAPPPHDRYVGLSGEIECKLTVVTPLFVSDSHRISENAGNKHKTYRFFQYDGQDAIPASTLKGAVRSVFEAATNSCFGSFGGQRLSHRESPATANLAARNLVPARLSYQKDGWQLELLPGATRLTVPGCPPANEEQYAAWLPRYLDEGGQRDPADYGRRPNVSLQIDTPRVTELKHGDPCCAVLRKIRVPPRGRRREFCIWSVAKLGRPEDHQALAQANPGCSVFDGYLSVNARNTNNKHDERFFFRSPSNHFGATSAQIDKSTVTEYWDLIQDYRARKDEIRRMTRAIGIKEVSRFVTEERYSRKMSDALDGELVYAQLTGTPQAPQIKYVVPVQVARRAYRYSIWDLLARDDSEYHLPCTSAGQTLDLCPACRVFGWVYDPQRDRRDPKRNNEEMPKDRPERRDRVAYAGRVWFTHGILETDSGVIEHPQTLHELSAPKPTTTFFYVGDEHARPSGSLDYNSAAARLRGRKFYRHFDPDDNYGESPVSRRIPGGPDPATERNRTVIGIREPGNAFVFTVRFRNLAPVELGALLWSLEMPVGEKQLHHHIGYGKPLGMGGCTISITGLHLLDVAARYAKLPPVDEGWLEALEHKERLIKAFSEGMQAAYGKPFAQLDNIIDLCALLSEPPKLRVHYPRTELGIIRNQYEWFGNNKNRQPSLALPLPAEDTQGFPYEIDAPPREPRGPQQRDPRRRQQPLNRNRF